MSANKRYGWIGLYRSITGHWLYPSGRAFTKYEAWIDLLLMVNHKDKEVFHGEDLVVCKRGEVITSQQKLMNKWGWSKSKLIKFLSVLEKDRMLAQKRDSKKTTISIVNYIDYQSFMSDDEIKKDRRKTVERPQTDHKQEVKEEKKSILSFLNEATGKNFKVSSKKTSDLIRARLNDGYTIEDFKKVIRVKTEQWKDTDMDKFLRPETLFSNKFESYLNEKPKSNERKFVC